MCIKFCKNLIMNLWINFASQKQEKTYIILVGCKPIERWEARTNFTFSSWALARTLKQFSASPHPQHGRKIIMTLLQWFLKAFLSYPLWLDVFSTNDIANTKQLYLLHDTNEVFCLHITVDIWIALHGQGSISYYWFL